MGKKALIKCVDGIIYSGIVQLIDDEVLILKDVKCNNNPNNMTANVGLSLGEKVTFIWDNIIWITYKED